ncbi:MAG: hypothetical protein AAFY11_05090 [Cyanobacteria bacterium J06641_5]
MRVHTYCQRWRSQTASQHLSLAAGAEYGGSLAIADRTAASP